MSFMKQSKFEIDNISEGKGSNEGQKGPAQRPPKHTKQIKEKAQEKVKKFQKDKRAGEVPLKAPSGAKPPVA